MQILSFNWIKSKSFCSIFQWVSFNSSLEKDWWLKAFFEVNKVFSWKNLWRKDPKNWGTETILKSLPSTPQLQPKQIEVDRTRVLPRLWFYPTRPDTLYSFPAQKMGVFLVRSPWEAPKNTKKLPRNLCFFFFFGGAGRFAEGLRFGFTSEADFSKFLQHWSARRATSSWRLDVLEVGMKLI